MTEDELVEELALKLYHFPGNSSPMSTCVTFARYIIKLGYTPPIGGA